MDWALVWEGARVLGIPLTMALIAVWALATGQVVAKSTLERELKYRDDRIGEERREKREAQRLALSSTKALEQLAVALRDERSKA